MCLASEKEYHQQVAVVVMAQLNLFNLNKALYIFLELCYCFVLTERKIIHDTNAVPNSQPSTARTSLEKPPA